MGKFDQKKGYKKKGLELKLESWVWGREQNFFYIISD